MRKVIVLMLVLGLVFGSIATAEAAKKKKKKKKKPVRIERTVEFDYQCPCGVRVLGQGLAWQLGESQGTNIGGGAIPISAEDVWVTAKAEDASGQLIAVGLSHDTDGDGLNNTWGTFCGETAEPIEMSHAESVMRVFVTSGTCHESPDPALATQGTITFTFSNLP